MWAHESTSILDHFWLELHQNTHRQWCGILASFARLHLNTFGNDCCSRFAPDVSNGVRSMLRFLARFIQPIHIFLFPLIIVHIFLSVATYWAAKHCPLLFLELKISTKSFINLKFLLAFPSLHSLQFNLQLWMCETWFCEVSATKSFDHGKSFEIFDQWKIKTKEEIVDFCDKFCQFQGAWSIEVELTDPLSVLQWLPLTAWIPPYWHLRSLVHQVNAKLNAASKGINIKFLPVITLSAATGQFLNPPFLSRDFWN